MSGQLILSIRNWQDGTGELRAEIRVDQFSGVGCANFDLQSLRESALNFAKFPISIGELIKIEGGYWDESEARHLTQEHLYIGVSAVSTRGALRMKVRLTQPYDTPTPDVRYGVSVNLNVEYQQLSKFAADLAALVEGRLDEVVVDAL